MKNSKKAILATAACLSMLTVTGTIAQPEIQLSELERADLGGDDNMEVIMSELTLPPGSSIPRHIHHGEELVHVLEGGMVETGAGEMVEFAIGMSMHFPWGLEHGGFTVIGDQLIRAITIHIVDKGKPLIVPVEQTE